MYQLSIKSHKNSEKEKWLPAKLCGEPMGSGALFILQLDTASFFVVLVIPKLLLEEI